MGTNTGIGIGIGIPFKNNALGGDRPYLPPELKARLIGVWDNYGKKNTDADRNIIKNKIPNAGGDLEILNAAYEGMSGYNGYPVIFGINKTWEKIPTYNSIYSINDNKIHFTKILFTNRGLIFSFIKRNEQLYNVTEIPSFKIRISGLKGDSKIRYSYIKTENAVYQTLLDLDNGIHELPKSLAPTDSIYNDAWIGFTITPRIENETSFDCDITIEILPEYEGSFVTDGVNDMIVSQNPVEEMGITDEFTVVSMIHHISDRYGVSAPLTNYIRVENNIFIRNSVSDIGKTGIYGYTCSNIKNLSSSNSIVINNILGDKNDYIIDLSPGDILAGKFSVQGCINDDNNIVEMSGVAWYWTFIAKRALTTDEINQVIAYYNLDKYVKPDIYYNVEKQGITNNNHAQFGDKLIDYSGNGRDLQLFNIGWKGESGIGRYTEEFKNNYWIVHREQTGVVKDGNSIKVVDKLTNAYIVYHIRTVGINSFKAKITGIRDKIRYSYVLSGVAKDIFFTKDGIYDIPASEVLVGDNSSAGFYFNDESVNLDWTGFTIEIIPSNKGALCLDGVNDFGQFVGDLGLKDYTVIIDRAYPIVSTPQFTATSDAAGENANTPFLIEHRSVDANESTYSYLANTAISINKEREICYQSTYQYKDTVINRGSSTSLGTGLTIARYGIDNGYSALALYSFMLFHYSMSKFLIERQLKKRKLGTLYPGMVEFRPIISGRTDLIKEIKWYSDSWSKRIYVGDYIPKGVDVAADILLNDNTSELVKATYGNNYTEVRKEANWSETNNEWDLIIHNIGKSPQKIDITIDEYIRFEDIVQPYPSLFTLIDYDTEEVYSWGSKLKVGARFKGDVVNLLPNMYEWQGDVLYNGEVLNWGINPGVVAKEMVFSWNMPFKYLIDNNEPKCILSPRLLRIPNSSYKILGYIPDISGHGNHGKINNSAYAGMSGANGYPYDYKNGFMAYSNCRLVDSEIFNVIFISSTVNIIKNTPTYKGKIKVTGLSGYLKLRIYSEDDSTNAIEILEDGVYDINIDNETGNVYFHVVKTKEGSNDISVIIQQVGEYEGAFYLDGVDDFVTIPTLSKGGKQVLMKVNWSTLNGFIYDQRPASGDKTFGIYAQDYVIAYSQNNNGNTYIDGIINNNIIGNNLSKITHNIVATCDVDNSITPSIGKCSYSNSYFVQMSLYDFMLFDEISTDDKIKELNTHIGITPKVTLPNYYWDNYGKKNTDANRGYINEQVSLQKTGTSVNPLENFNIGYKGMSGYNGYPVVLGANKTWETSNAVDYIYDINSTIVHITNVKHAANALLYSYVKKDGALANIKEIPAFRVTVKGLEENSKLIYKYLATENATKESIVYLGNGIHKLPKSFVPTDALLDLTTNSWIGFAITPMIEGELVFDCDITIEILPEYENGLAYDGVSDFTDNKNIPIFTDFTAIIKRVDLDAKNDNSTVMFKGNKIYESSIGNGFILDYCYNSKNYVYSYGKLNQIERDDSKIIYLTPESYNGNSIIKGENEDNPGLVLGKYWKGIIYKTILYSKTISLLEINFLKNLMEKDEIIDINHPVFISNTEDESNTSQDT